MGRYDCLTFPQVPVGCRLVERDGQNGTPGGRPRVYIHGVGQVKVVLHRPLAGTPKTATIRRHSTGKWYVAFSCECAEPTPLPPTGQQVGLDMGLVVFAMPNEGEPIDTPRFFRTEERALAQAQRRLSTVEQGAPERAARRKVVARVYERMRGRHRPRWPAATGGWGWRMGLAQHGQPVVLGVTSQEPLWAMLEGRWGQPRADESAARVPVRAWRRLSAGDGAQGPRRSDWARVPLARLHLRAAERRWAHGRLVRRRLSAPTDLAYDVVAAPRGTPLRAGAGGWAMRAD